MDPKPMRMSPEAQALANAAGAANDARWDAKREMDDAWAKLQTENRYGTDDSIVAAEAKLVAAEAKLAEAERKHKDAMNAMRRAR